MKPESACDYHPRVKVVGFGFQARAGKDAAGDYILEKLPYARKRCFADSLKEACAVIFGFKHEQLYGRAKGVVDPFWGMTPRHVLQQVGTEAIRNVVGSDVWVKSWEQHVRQHARPGELWMACDVRFPNEAEAIKSMGGLVVKIERPAAMRSKVPDHESERAMLDYKEWDYVIENNSKSIRTFHAQIDEFLKVYNL
jgi:hypothetical protein